MDLDKFRAASMKPREAEVQVPELAEFFGEGEAPVWKVRGLTAAELGRTREAGDRAESMKKLVEAMAGNGDKAAAIRDQMGLNDDEVPADVSRRIEQLALGSVSPEIGEANREDAVKLSEDFPIVFYTLTNKIQELTGQGAAVGKPKRSGGSKTSS